MYKSTYLFFFREKRKNAGVAVRKMIGLFLLIITIMIVVDDNENDIRILNSWNRDDDDDKAYVRICAPKCEENYGNGGWWWWISVSVVSGNKKTGE